MSFQNNYAGQANTTTSDAIATAFGAGVTPPDYTTSKHYQYHKMLGENARVTPKLLGMDSPLTDTPYPSRAQITALGLQDIQPEFVFAASDSDSVVENELLAPEDLSVPPPEAEPSSTAR